MSVQNYFSVTHVHIFSCLCTLLKNKLSPSSDGEPIRILDIGCGDGRLMSYLHAAFRGTYAHRQVEVFGFDVSELGYGVEEEYKRALGRLENGCPDVNWLDRLQVISVQDSWPYADNFFDAAITNQVLEHVEDADGFLASLKRVLKRDGVSIHVFPLGHTIMEGHVNVPVAHWIRDAELQQFWIGLSNRLGIGNWRRDRKLFGDQGIDDYARSQSRYLQRGTFYRNFEELYRLCKRHGLSLSYSYTAQFFSAKLRSLLGVAPVLDYGRGGLFGLRWLPFLLLRYISSSTIVIRPVHYDVGARIHAQKELRSQKESEQSNELAASVGATEAPKNVVVGKW